MPTTGPQTATLYVDTSVTGSGSASPYDFWFKDDNTVYVADDRTIALGGGIQKWEFNSDTSTWDLSYTLDTGSGARGLTGTVVGSDTVLYATTFGNSANNLITLTDTGAASAFTILATAPTNTIYRGVAFVPGAAGGLPGDFNNDGKVDAGDYVTWRKNDGTNNALPNDNGLGTPITSAHYDLWRENFGTPPGAGSGSGLGEAAVPEPASAALLLIGIVTLCWRRRSA